MKAKTKKTLLSLASSIVLVSSMFGLSSCSFDFGGETDAERPYGLVSDFENYDEINKFTFEWYFGSASINTDPQYVTSGKASMKVTNTKKTAAKKNSKSVKANVPVIPADPYAKPMGK